MVTVPEVKTEIKLTVMSIITSHHPIWTKKTKQLYQKDYKMRVIPLLLWLLSSFR